MHQTYTTRRTLKWGNVSKMPLLTQNKERIYLNNCQAQRQRETSKVNHPPPPPAHHTTFF